MTLSRKIADALEAASDQTAMPRVLTVDDGAHRLHLTLTAAGPVGLAFDTLEFSTITPGSAVRTPREMKAWADRLVARVTYLMEPFVVVEHDHTAGEVELRSQSPTPRGMARSFYEVRLNQAGTLRLSRVRFEEATRRRNPIPCQLTVEVLERLADDLAACAS